MLLGGEAGAGKTALLRTFAARTPGARILVVVRPDPEPVTA